ncbi:MAG TPA: secretion system protein [Anaerolineales bacterium]|nr:secretion system protein [Anaerolineales bacterium]
MATTILIGGGVLAVILLLVGIIISIGGEKSLVEERLGQYTEDEFDERIAAAAAESETSALTDWVNVQVEKSSWGEGIAKNLAQADVKLKPGEYAALIVILVISLGALAYFIGGQDLISAGIGIIIALILPGFYIKRQKGQRLQKFNEQLPDMLNLMVNGLRAGYSTVQAMEAVSKELPPPISVEFRRLVQEMQIGIPMEQALDNLYRRIPSEDLDLIIAAINVQREVGGNLAEILDTISYTIRERVRIKGEIRVLTSQVVYSGRFLAMLPFILGAILWFINRPYMMLFFSDPKICGIIMIGAIILMVSSGYFAMTRVANIEV